MKPSHIILLLILTSCSNSSKKDKTGSDTFENRATISEDSCRKWNLPLISFKIDYPPGYKVFYHDDDNYLALKKYNDSGYIQQEFSFGQSENIDSKEKVQKWTYALDSLLKDIKTYKTQFIGYKTIGNKNLFLINGTINFDYLGQSEYNGNYNVIVTLIPSYKQPNGLTLSFITTLTDSLDQYQEINYVLNNLRFLKK